MHPTLRRMLLHQLREKSGPKDRWNDLHGKLLAYYRPDPQDVPSPENELLWHYHALAMGRVGDAVRFLTQQFEGGQHAGEWYRILRAVTAAPSYSYLTEAADPGAAVRKITEPFNGRDEQTRRIAELIAALWIWSDPLRGHSATRILELLIAAQLEHLAGLVSDGFQRLIDEADQFKRGEAE